MNRGQLQGEIDGKRTSHTDLAEKRRILKSRNASVVLNRYTVSQNTYVELQKLGMERRLTAAA